MSDKKYTRFSQSFYDENHDRFRRDMVEDLYYMFEQKYVNRFRLEGDPNFTIQKQRKLFEYAFQHGFASITDIAKIKNKQFFKAIQADERVVKILRSVPLFNTELTPLIVSPIRFSEDELIVQGHGTNGGRSNIRRIATIINAEDSAFLTFNSRLQNGIMYWQTVIYLLATNLTVFKKKLQLSDVKILTNSVNNAKIRNIFSDIYRIGADLIKVNPAQGSFSANDGQSMVKNVMSNMMGTDLQKLDMSNQDTLDKVLQSFNDTLSMAQKIKGLRANVYEKKERAITAEFIADDLHFKLLEREWREMVEIFVVQYEHVFGIKLKIVDLVEECEMEYAESQTSNEEHANSVEGDSNE